MILKAYAHSERYRLKNLTSALNGYIMYNVSERHVFLFFNCVQYINAVKDEYNNAVMRVKNTFCK